MKKGWEVKNLGEVCELITRGVSPKYDENNGICVLNQKCIRNHKIDYEFSRLHDDKIKPTSNEKLIQIGDVLVNSTGTGTLGRVAQVRENPFKSVVDSHVTIVRPIKNKFYNAFFGYAMICIEDDIATRGEGCGGQTELARNTLKTEFEIHYPQSLAEQQRIVAILDEASDAIARSKENAKKNLQNAREIFESYLQSVFANRGDGWEEKKLGEIIENNVIGLTKSSSEQGFNMRYKYVKMNNITRDNSFDFSKYTCVDATKEDASKYSLDNGDFLFNTRNSYELVGKTCIFEMDGEETILFNNNIMRVRFIEKINSHFINYAFSSKTVIENLDHFKSGTTNVSAIYYKDLKNLSLSIPPFPEQQSIVAKLDALSTETKKLEAIYNRKLTDLEELKKSILQKAFNGEL